MIKKWLGIRDIEDNMKQMKVFLRSYSEQMKSLYMNHASHHSRISELERNHRKVEDLERKMDSMLSMMEKIVLHLEEMESQDYAVEEPQGVYQKEPEAYEEVAEKVYEAPVKREVFVGNKDKIILQILHQNAAFEANSAVSTSKIYSNLTFNITQRGLRKKLDALQKSGLISGTKEGKSCNWFVRTGELSTVKELIAEPAKKKRNRN
jgi:hypothetical protein